ncbi:hypothetical protein [Caproiciproducens sp.]|nr:hypothetical protein [Caproiciproducens sp.]
MKEINFNKKMNLAEENSVGAPAYQGNEYEIPDEASCSAEFISGCIFSE